MKNTLKKMLNFDTKLCFFIETIWMNNIHKVRIYQLSVSKQLQHVKLRLNLKNKR